MPPKKTHEVFVQEIKSRYGDEYSIIGRYVSVHTPIMMKHNKCGHEWNTTAPYDLLKSRPNTCPKCSHQSWKYTTLEYSKKVTDETFGSYKLLSEYINNKSKVTYKHLECGTVWQTRPDLFNQGHRCPTCGKKKSKVEIMVRELLSSVGLDFEEQKTIDGIHHILSLTIDFYLEDKRLVIECDGEQHYKIKRGGSSEFKKTLERDRSKFQKCRDQGIELIRIPAMMSVADSRLFLMKLLYERGLLEIEV